MREGGRRIGTAREGYIVPDQVEPRQKMIQNVFLSAAPAGFGLAVAAGVGELLSGLGSRWGWWPFPFGFQVLEWTAIAGLVAALLCVVGILLALHRSSRRALLSAVLGLIIGVVTAGIPAYWFAAASRAPMIHDITTDTQNPPAFKALLAVRGSKSNSVEYGGAAVAAQQHAAYPDVKPLVLAAAPDRVFERSLAVARDMGWDIAAADRRSRRIEATATTFWFGFKDDIVIRITPEGAGSRVDIRSLSRVGVSDIGTNARRIERFLRILSRSRWTDPAGGRSRERHSALRSRRLSCSPPADRSLRA